MAGERRINWGADETDAQYRTGDDDANDRFIVAEDLDGATVLLEYDETNSEWVSRGPVNMDGNAIENISALGTSSNRVTEIYGSTVNTEKVEITSQSSAYAYPGADQSIASASTETVALDSERYDNNGDFDTPNNKYVVPSDGIYLLDGAVRYNVGSDQDQIYCRIAINGGPTRPADVSFAATGTNRQSVPASAVDSLSAGDEITLQARNNNSSDTVKSGLGSTYLAIHKVA